MRLALAQIDVTVGDIPGNASRILEAIEAARDGAADAILFPELALTGYPPRDLLFHDEFVADAEEATRVIAHAAPDIDVVLGTVDRARHSPSMRDEYGCQPQHPPCRNVACLLRGGRVVATQAKRLTARYDVFHEARYFEPGDDLDPVEVAGRPTGLLVCEDMWDEDYRLHPPAELVASGATLLLNLSASPYRRGVLAERLHHARRHETPLVYLNAVGGQDELIFDGGSFVLDGEGRVVHRLPRFEEVVEVVDLQAADVPDPFPDPAPARTLFGALALGVRDFCLKNGLERAFCGLSGGIDSSLVACIAREGLGPERVTGVAMPSRHSDERSTTSARELAGNLGIEFQVRPIESMHETAEEALSDLVEGPDAGTTPENVQARLRMLVLMALVNRHRGLLLNTSNKTELSLGYGTLYADMAGGLGVISDLTKPEVYEVARWYADRTGHIPAFILEREPTAELAPDQTDPFDYDRVGPLTEAIVHYAPFDALEREHGAAPDEIARLDDLVRVSEHKRWQSPVGLKVKPITFGTGRLFPVTNRWVRMRDRGEED